MMNNNSMKKYLKFIFVILLGEIIYFISIQALSLYFDPSIKNHLSWGISVWYSYLIYFLALALSVGLKILNRRYYIIGLVTIFIGYLFYWKSSYLIYPNRTVGIIFISLAIYIAVHLSLFHKEKSLFGKG